jgi:O-methyltransferase
MYEKWSSPVLTSLLSRWFTAIADAMDLRLCVACIEYRGIPGVIVECGVGKGLTACAATLLALESTNRELYLYATSDSIAEAKQALMRTRYPWEKMRFVPGPVAATIPNHVPDQIALLNLDTEWAQYGLEHLYPRLVEGGVLIVDGCEIVKQSEREIVAA